MSALPLVEALATLGGRVELEILGAPTLAGLSEALATAKRPYHVVHFDGHGIYSRERGLGALCFENPADADKLEGRRTDLVDADKLAEVMRHHRVPLVFLEACQSARSDDDPSASVAGRLLRGGVASVLAMSHSVLVATAKRFVEVFYQRLSHGATVGAAMLAAQRRLRDDPSRGRSFYVDLKLADWFVPVLYQEAVDPQLVRERPGRLAREDIALLGRKAVEDLPPSPPHGFVGRSRELLKIERLLVRERYAMLVGEGGVPLADAEGSGHEEIDLLVATAQHHARSLVLLAQEVKKSGVRRTTDGLRELMVTMAERYPDDRQRSLFASVELSLRRLPGEMREKLRRLGVFQGGGHGYVIAQVLGLDYENDEEVALGDQLIAVGLAERMPYGHLRLHPALPPMMLHELSETERQETRGIWVEATTQLVGFLYQQRSKDAQLAAVLTLLELPNLLSALDTLHRLGGDEGGGAERVVAMATSLEGLLQHLGRPKALARVVEVREEASRRLGEWSSARFSAKDAEVDRLLDTGYVAEAAAKAKALLRKARAAGVEAYAGAAYDLAMACFSLGRALKRGGAAAAALEPLTEARQRFGQLAEAGNAAVGSTGAERMASACLTETGDCLRDLGRLDEAAEAYETTIELDEARGDRRDVATGKLQLATVQMLQRRHGEALEAFHEARQLFEQLGEPGSVATAWHQVGNVHQQAGQLDAAEHAYQQSLAIKVRRGDRPHEARTLNQLGNLYSRMGRLEDSVRFYRDAVTIFGEIGDLKNEGFGRNNLAVQLLELRRHDEARQEILRAIECDKPSGHAAEPWKTFMILHNLERAVGNTDAATKARRQAIEAFLAYRRDGGGDHAMAAQLAAGVGQAIASAQVEAMASQLGELAGRPDLPDDLRQVIPALQTIVAGSRDPALASDPGLDYDDAAELLLLLESLD